MKRKETRGRWKDWNWPWVELQGREGPAAALLTQGLGTSTARAAGTQAMAATTSGEEQTLLGWLSPAEVLGPARWRLSPGWRVGAAGS